MNLFNVLKMLLTLERSISGKCKVHICAYGEFSLRLLFGWADDNIRMYHNVDAVELQSVDEEILTLFLIDKANRAYREEMEKKLKKTPAVSIDDYFESRRKTQ